MPKEYSTDQEEFWAGSFGDEYSLRNTGDDWIAANCALFAKVLSRTREVRSVIEFGSNIGLNLRAVEMLLPGCELAAIEINAAAAARLREWGRCTVHEQSILDFEPDRQHDFVLVKGVLIHISPESLPRVYDRLYRASGRYICVVEYFNPTPVALSYRGHGDRLFKRDFAGEMLDAYDDMRLVDYGFCYRRDPNFRQDDVTWFLLERT